ncbi:MULTISPECIES: malto-oligosyltrehalose synthase [unclassified Aeromicrobium]|uniref:malto-oligosyltrehalose synthase n=1 Tax=unclassified Aeromicrobium TaxID=2633570 RepID=UPI000A516B33|nr:MULTISPECIES: malto-oligosyltrehalose synthase [unclassified Aeromicrobium]
MSAPSSTYRLQLRPGFGFAEAQALVPYLRDLGVGAVYVSPVLDATPGSTHGYDVTDPTQARPELGGPEGWDAFTATVREAGLGLVVDVVPNHMSVEVPRANPWWWSVLAEGEASPWAGHFDVDWSRGRLLVPVLGDDADVAELALDGDELTYDDHRFPIDAGTLADPSFASMTPQQVHDRQHYELVGWRRGGAELNYRRFFDITTLAAVRVEDEQVFDDTHREVLRWVEEGRVTGLRIDHPDGLSDPGGYLRRLHEAAPDAWLVVEKILHPGEELPTTWPVDGTTGYDAMREVAGVLLDRGGNGRGGEAPWQTLTERLGAPADYAAVEEDARRMVTRKVLVAEVRRIAALVRDVHQDAARTAVAETMVAFGVYRSYLPEAGREAWDAAIERARTRRPDVDPAIRALDAQVTEEPTGELATRIQQTSGMVVAKGTEDTTFYRFTRFAALNEVGGSPDVWGVDVDGFHALAAAREADHPTAMTALTTHDTKRSEDTRARMLTLAELGEEVTSTVADWSARCGIDEPALDLLAWQTLLGAWPISDERLSDYLLKAARESKVRTTWTETDEAFEESVAAWPARVRAELGPQVQALVGRVQAFGWTVSLSQKLLQLAGPGVPDVYQGTEGWDFSLVDPDNRRPVDHEAFRTLLRRLDDGWLPHVDASGAAKTSLVRRVLTLRRDRPELFRGYTPLAASGEAADHAVAFGRSDDLVAVATRLPVGLEHRGGWGGTTLPLGSGTWTDALTGERFDGGDVRLADLLATYPVALLTRPPLVE